MVDDPDPAPALEEHTLVAVPEELPPAAPETDRQAVIREIVPNTLRSLYLLRISLYALTACLALVKVILSPTVSSFLLDLFTDTPGARAILVGWVLSLQSLVSGLLAGSLALVVATFLIQVRLLAEAGRESADLEKFTLSGRGPGVVLATFGKETVIALITGLLTFGSSELLARGPLGTAGAFGLLAAVTAGALDTLYFHLLFLLRQAPVHASEKRYREVIEQAQARLVDGSMRLREALIGRFEADYRRTVVANRSTGRSHRQIREAGDQLRARLWVIDRVIPGHQLVAFPSQAREDPNLLERWTEEVDWLVNAATEVKRRQGFFTRRLGFLHPGALARQTMQERHSFAGAA